MSQGFSTIKFPLICIKSYVLEISETIESTSDSITYVIPKGPYEENAASKKAAGTIIDN